MAGFANLNLAESYAGLLGVTDSETVFAVALDRLGEGAGATLALEFTVSRVGNGACTPLPGAQGDVWQCDARGVYDNRGYRFRGHQFTNAKGQYTLFTVVPGLYPGRTRHIHVKVQAPRRPVLTTADPSPAAAWTRSTSTDSLFDCRLSSWCPAPAARADRSASICASVALP